METEIVDGKRVPMRWWNVKLSTKHLAFIMMLLSHYRHKLPFPTSINGHKDVYTIAEIKEAINDARSKGEP